MHKGLFIAPTVFDGVTPQMRIGREEIFGPVMSVLSWEDNEDMLAKATASSTAGPRRSSATISPRQWSGRAHRGGVRMDQLAGPLSRRALWGWKQSGIGEEECFDELLSYTRVKTINMRW